MGAHLTVMHSWGCSRGVWAGLRLNQALEVCEVLAALQGCWVQDLCVEPLPTEALLGAQQPFRLCVDASTDWECVCCFSLHPQCWHREDWLLHCAGCDVGHG